MRTRRRYILAILATAIGLFCAGFVMFALSASREAAPIAKPADGIVVLTGGGGRIAVGAKLLASGHAHRLLISGVNRRTRPADIRRLAKLGSSLFQCCVDIGYEARNTIGNAMETRKWVKQFGVRRLIVVTSSYHMLRSLTELRAALPSTDLVPYPVVPPSLKQKPWWLSMKNTRTLAAEYLKLMPAAARYAVARLLQPFNVTGKTSHADVLPRQ